MSTQKPVLAIIGPTASGKTSLALQLAKTHPIEIISLDSALVFQDMDIGTAKPSKEEMQEVPHHLIDIITPLEAYNAADFVNDTKKLVKEIQNRGRVPVIVGGTMMYFKALTEGLNDLPSADPEIRTQLQERKDNYGLSSLYDQLKEVDPETAARLESTDSQRIERALEIYLLTGKPLSQHFLDSKKTENTLDLYTLALIPENREQLHLQITKRFDIMLAQGFINEVQNLKVKYPELTEDHTSIRCVGYRQAWQYLDNKISAEQIKEQGIIATRQLAKRQLTWLRKTIIQKAIDPFNTPKLQTALNFLQEEIDNGYKS